MRPHSQQSCAVGELHWQWIELPTACLMCSKRTMVWRGQTQFKNREKPYQGEGMHAQAVVCSPGASVEAWLSGQLFNGCCLPDQIYRNRVGYLFGFHWKQCGEWSLWDNNYEKRYPSVQCLETEAMWRALIIVGQLREETSESLVSGNIGLVKEVADTSCV